MRRAKYTDLCGNVVVSQPKSVVVKHVPPLEPPIVFVHGLKGSHLRKRDDCPCACAQPYLSAEALLFGPCCSGQYQFELPWEYDSQTEEQATDGLIAHDVLWRLYGCGCVPLVDVHEDIRIWAQSNKRRFFGFAYDWRRSPQECGNRMEEFLESVLEKDFKRTGWDGGVQVIAYSYGALITIPVLNRRPDLFHSTLFIGAAANHGTNLLPDLCQWGGLENTMPPANRTMMTPKNWIGWSSGYYFLPSKGSRTGPHNDGPPYFAEADGVTEVEIDLHDVRDWERYKLGAFHPMAKCAWIINNPTLRSKYINFLSETLRRAKEFRQLVVHDADNVDYPPIAVLGSSGVPTAVTWRRPTPESAFVMNVQDEILPPITSDGDGRIPTAMMNPPPGIPILARIVTQATHQELASDVVNIESLLRQLSDEALKRGKLMGGLKG